jgi:hypothetical protein
MPRERAFLYPAPGFRICLAASRLERIPPICQANSPQVRITDSSFRNAVSFSSPRTTILFPSSRCASTIQIVRPLESMAADGRDSPLPWQRERSCIEVDLSAEVEGASRACKASRTAGYKSDFGVIEHALDIRWRQAPRERARDTVAVSCCKNVAADVRQITDIEDEFCGPGEASQLRGGSAVDGFSKLMALVQRRNRSLQVYATTGNGETLVPRAPRLVMFRITHNGERISHRWRNHDRMLRSSCTRSRDRVRPRVRVRERWFGQR